MTNTTGNTNVSCKVAHLAHAPNNELLDLLQAAVTATHLRFGSAEAAKLLRVYVELVERHDV